MTITFLIVIAIGVYAIFFTFLIKTLKSGHKLTPMERAILAEVIRRGYLQMQQNFLDDPASQTEVAEAVHDVRDKLHLWDYTHA